MYLCIGEKNCNVCFAKKDCALRKDIMQTNSLNGIKDNKIKYEYKKEIKWVNFKKSLSVLLCLFFGVSVCSASDTYYLTQEQLNE